MTTQDPAPSKNQLNVAGKRIRKRHDSTVLELDGPQVADDERLVRHWRSMHSSALATTRVGLGTIVMRTLRLESQAGLVIQRLKRYDSIVDKLVRDKTRLSEIEDIAGCRAVLPDLSAVMEVADCVDGARRMTLHTARDYNQAPQLGMYRALHLWCRRGGFKVEVQLRTERQQQWAELVEEWDSTLGVDIKHGDAPQQALDYFRHLSEYFHLLDNDVDPEDIDTTMLADATAVVRRWLTEEVFA